MKIKGAKDHGHGMKKAAAAMMPDVVGMNAPAMPQGMPQAMQPPGMKKGGAVSDGLKKPIPKIQMPKFAGGGKVAKSAKSCVKKGK